MAELSFRFAVREDTPLILSFIRALAAYEQMADQVIATEELLAEQLFDRGNAEVLFALEDGKEVGFALFFHNFSTFLGRAGIFLEDLYVLPECRGRGYGRALMKELARVAAERGCGRLEWQCLDWNRPGIGFYLSLGAEPMEDWTVYRLAGEALKEMATGNPRTVTAETQPRSRTARAARPERPCCKGWPASRVSAAAAGWSGGAWTGTDPASTSISHWVPSPCATGRSTVSAVRRSRPCRISLSKRTDATDVCSFFEKNAGM